jgi:hypothetical protein
MMFMLLLARSPRRSAANCKCRFPSFHRAQDETVTSTAPFGSCLMTHRDLLDKPFIRGILHRVTKALSSLRQGAVHEIAEIVLGKNLIRLTS